LKMSDDVQRANHSVRRKAPKELWKQMANG
jgi:hypothetical protein